MAKKIFSKTKTADIFVLIIRIILIAFSIYLAYIAIIVIKEFNRAADRKKGAINYFEEVCEYVKENESVFREFAEYHFSLLNGDDEVIVFEPNGDMQEERDIIFRYFHTGGIHSDDGELNASFDCYYDSSYVIMLIMSNDIGKRAEENEMRKNIGDDMCIILVRERY